MCSVKFSVNKVNRGMWLRKLLVIMSGFFCSVGNWIFDLVRKYCKLFVMCRSCV